MKKLALMAAIALSPALANASVTLNMANGVFYKADGTTPLPTGSTLVLLADANNNGFGDLTQATTTFKADPGDVVLARFASNDFAAGPGSSFDAIQFDFTGLTAGRAIELVWYDTPFNAGATGPGNSVHFGVFRSSSILSFSDIGWNVPSDGSAFNLNFLTQSTGGDSPESAGIASFITAAAPVPEPTSGIVALIGMGLASLFRRNRNA